MTTKSVQDDAQKEIVENATDTIPATTTTMTTTTIYTRITGYLQEGWDTLKHKFDSPSNFAKNVTLFNDARELKKSVAADVVNKEAHPELEKVAFVRQGNELNEEEIKLVRLERKRQGRVLRNLSADLSDIHMEKGR